MRIVKAIVLLGLVGFIGLVAFAYLGDLAPERREIVTPLPSGVVDGR
ncbi:MAG: hypothetical protein RLZ26_777 [Pseudomonadota bacterium]|jgi:hypothetical protein